MTVRDEFFWLGEINKATLVINSRQGLLPMPIAEEAAKALREVLADGDADPTKRAKTYITFEPLMLKKADPVITLMHAGRSSQDMHATYRSAILRDHVLEVGDALNAVLETMTDLAWTKTVKRLSPTTPTVLLLSPTAWRITFLHS